MKPFAEWTYEDAAAAVTAATARGLDAAAYAANVAIVEDRDYWQDGVSWPGPRGTPEVWTRLKALILAQFTPVDVANEALERVANALLKTEAGVGFAAVETVPDAPEGASEAAAAAVEQRRALQQAEADAMRAHLAAWWDRVQFWRAMRRVIVRARAYTRATGRTWLPRGLLVEGPRGARALPTGLSLAEAFRRVQFDAPAPDAAAVVTDPHTQARAAVFLFTEEVGGTTTPGAEVWFAAAGAPGAAPSTPTDTVVRILTGKGDAATAQAFTVPLGGRLPVVELEAELLLTDPVRRQQHALNFSESLINRVMEAAGFPERYTANAAPSGMWLDVAPSDGTAPLDVKEGKDGKTYYLHEVPRTIGAGMLTELVGFQYDTGPQGERGFTTPSVVKFDPTDPEFAIKVSTHRRAMILGQCKQAHVLGVADALASGYKLEQARADFEDDLSNTKTPAEGFVRDALAAAVAYACAMAEGGPDAALARGFLERYRVVVNLTVNSGPLSPDEQRVVGERVKGNLLSRASGMAMQGVEDVDDELAQIAAQPDATLATVTAQATALKALTDAGAAIEGAAARVGMSKDEVAALLQGAGDGGGAPAVTQ